jgi:glycine C-acetyltransferase
MVTLLRVTKRTKLYRTKELSMSLKPSEFYDGTGIIEDDDLFFTKIEGYSPADNNIVHTKFGELTVFTNYSYLGLLRHPAITRAVSDANQMFGSGGLGARFLSGTTSIHTALESEMAQFMGVDQTLTFSSGYTANTGLLSALARKEDTIFLDQYTHACSVEGARLSGATMIYFRHNDEHDLDRLLRKQALENVTPTGPRKVFVVVEGLYSMHGDIARLPEISSTCRRFDNVVLVVDEAHSIGVLGQTGRGIVEHFGLDATSVDFRTGTFSKAIPSTGGFVTGSHAAIQKLRYDAKPFMYSAGLNCLSAAAALAAVRLILEEPERVAIVRERSTYLRKCLTEAGHRLPFSDVTPIVPVLCGSTENAAKATKFCRDHGLLVSGIAYPVVPKDFSLLRVSVTATHTHDQIDHLVEVLSAAASKFNLPGWKIRGDHRTSIAKL